MEKTTKLPNNLQATFLHTYCYNRPTSYPKPLIQDTKDVGWKAQLQPLQLRHALRCAELFPQQAKAPRRGLGTEDLQPGLERRDSKEETCLVRLRLMALKCLKAMPKSPSLASTHHLLSLISHLLLIGKDPGAVLVGRIEIHPNGMPPQRRWKRNFKATKRVGGIRKSLSWNR